MIRDRFVAFVSAVLMSVVVTLPAKSQSAVSDADLAASARAKMRLEEIVHGGAAVNAFGITANACSGFASTLSCGTVYPGSLSAGDCTLSDGTYVDLFVLNVTPGQRFTITGATSGSWQIFMTLHDYDTADVLTYTDGRNSASITYTATKSTYIIGFTSLDWYAFGSYTLSIACTTSCVAPAITVHPQSVTVVNGTAAVSVSASGTTPMTYQWYTGNRGDVSRPVAFATNAAQTFTGITQTTSVWARVRNACGSADSNAATLSVAPPPTVCTPDARTACLLDNRFQVKMTFTDNIASPPRIAEALPIRYAENAPMTSGTYGTLGELTFFAFYDWAPKKVEVVAKIYKGIGINDKYWVYVAGMTDADFTITIRDTRSGLSWTRHNPQGSYLNVADLYAFPFP